MRKVLRGDAKDKNSNLSYWYYPNPINKDKCPATARRERRRLVRQGGNDFKKEAVR
jgi:hypothetical protein